MNRITRNIAALIAFGIGTTTIGFAQVTQQKIGDNPTLINPNAALEIESTAKGLLMPRLALTATNNFAPLAAHVAGMTVYNTATAGVAPNNVTPGYYYNDGTQWVRVATGADAKTEPWRQQNTTNEATANTQNIYQQGKVAVGFTSADAVTSKQMEVKGDFKSEITAAGGVVGTEVGSPLNPNGAMHYWSNGTDYRTASANDLSATLEAKTGTTTNTFAAGSTQAQMASQNGTNSLSTVRTLNTGEFRLESYNVANNFGSTVSLQNDGLRLRHTNTNGALDPFPANNLTEILVRKAEGVQFSYQNAAGNSLSAYWFPITTGAAGQVMTQTGTGKMVWTNPSTLFSEVDGVIGNEVTDATANGGLTRTGTGTTASPYTLGLTPGSVTGDVMTWNGTAWNPAAAVNIYNANGTLTSNRTLTLGGFPLNFTGTEQTVRLNSLGWLTINGQDTNSSFMRMSTVDGNANGVRSYFDMQLFPDNMMQMYATDDVTRLTIATHETLTPAPIEFATSSGASAPGLVRMTITPTGEVAIGATTAPSFSVGATTVQPKLHIAGDVSTTGKYYTTNSVYADYVFEKYFNGSSNINPNYEFKSLDYVKDFIKANNHLPGVESINDLAKAENGYTFDMTKLTVQSLEKIEELYLHTIEQQDKIDAQQVEIDQLKKKQDDMEARMKRLETLILQK